MHLLSGVLASAPPCLIVPISKVSSDATFLFDGKHPEDLFLKSCAGDREMPVRGKEIRVHSVRWTPGREEIVVLRCLAPALLSAMLTLSPAFLPPESIAQSSDIQRGTTLFRRACIGCHDSGGNIIQPGATLFINDLRRNGVDSEEGIYGITYSGKGRMPGFGENCTPRGQCTFGPRLQEEEIRELARFVKLQAEQGWPNIEMGQD